MIDELQVITRLQNKELERTKSPQTAWGLRRSIQCSTTSRRDG